MTMSHSEGLRRCASMASWGVMVASMGVSAPGLSQATLSTLMRPRRKVS